MRAWRNPSGLLGPLCVAVCAVLLPGSVQADPIRLSVYANAAGSITDSDGDGVDDSGGPFMVVLPTSTGFQARALAEYDLRGRALEQPLLTFRCVAALRAVCFRYTV